MMSKYQYKPTIYFIFAIAITWISGFTLAVQSRQGGEANIFYIILCVFGPCLAALIMMVFFGNKALRIDFRKRLFNIGLINKKYLPFVIFFLPLAMVVSILISIAFGQPADQLRFTEGFIALEGEAVFGMILLVLISVVEELGWRGYGVDSLASKFNLFKTSLIFGALWGAWHLPLFFIKDTYQNGVWVQNPIFAINFFVGLFPLVFIMNYLFYKNQRSISLLALFHVMVNICAELFAANQVSKCIFTVVLTAVAVLIVIRNKEFFFKNKMNVDLQGAVRKEKRSLAI